MVEHYHVSDLISLAGDKGRIIVTMDRSLSEKDDDYAMSLRELLDAPPLRDRIEFACVDESGFTKKKDGLLSKYSSSAESVVKKNIMEMIGTTIQSYLEGYWKDSETVNSEVTDSLFRAKHKLISTMFWEMERDTWNAMMEEITTRVQELHPGEGDTIIVDVERKYWLHDKLIGE